MSASFSTLATISLQLIMQHLDARSFVSAAVCSRHAFSAASSVFAMRFISPITLRITDLCEDRRCTPRSLLRFVDVKICCHGCPFSEEVLASMQSIPRLRGLDLSFYRHDYGLAPLHELSNLGGITELKVGMSLSQLQAELIAERLPQLHTLHLLVRQLSLATRTLHRVSNLTCLALTSLESDAFTLARLSPLAACLKLTHLILIQTEGRAIVSVMQHAILSQRLIQLELRQCDTIISNGDDSAVWSSGFAAMQGLRSLALRACNNVGVLLVAAAEHAKALETILVRPKDDQVLDDPIRDDYTVPSLSEVQIAMHRRAAVKPAQSIPFCIQLQFSMPYRELNTRLLGAPRWEIELNSWSELETKTLDNRCRFRLLIDAPPDY